MNGDVAGLLQKNAELAPLTTWLVGGRAEFLAIPQNPSELQQLLAWAQKNKISVSILGGGSNVLIADEGVKGLVICLRKLAKMESAQESVDEKVWRLTCWAGTSKSELLKFCLKNKLGASLFLAGLPGDLGGGVVMNAGVSEAFKPREFCEIIEWVEVLRPEGHFEKVKANQFRWEYRHSSGWQPGIISRVGIVLSNEPYPEVVTKVREANQLRLSKQPLDMPSCGSVFRNPAAGPKAAQLIDSLGLKGYTVGGAQVSPKHANFIVNLGGAKAEDIYQVMKHVQISVLESTQTRLQTEVVFMGPWESSL